ncbi:MAG: gliding motility-associated C-terminal domain-containing protein [Bacteroidota bacterium]
MQFLFLTGYAAVFTVTNNRDSGAGSFREALLLAAANGNSNQDEIRFSISDLSESGRTIVLLTQLPNTSSNLVIDASTQPGAKFGLSSAKVKLLTEFPFQGTYYGLALIGVHDVEIYGFYIQNLTDYNPAIERFSWRGISISNCVNIKIGAAGKGNVISGFYHNIGFNVPTGGQVKDYSEEITIQDNFIGIESDGSTLPQFDQTSLQADFVYGKFVIGGRANEGNLIPTGFWLHQANTYDTTDPADRGFTLPAEVLVANNKFGVDYQVTKGYPISTGLHFATVNPNGKSTIVVEDNIISNTKNYGIYTINIGRQVTIRRNYIGTDKTLSKKLPVGDAGVFIYETDHVLIGGDDPADANHIGYCTPVIVWPYATVAVKKNSFFCTVNAYPMIPLPTNRFVPVVAIDASTVTQVKGTATPNSVIELFYSDNCGTCSPETYFASTTADGNGNWVYNGLITGVVIASATFNNSTSEFTRTVIDITSFYTVPTCTNTGAIIGVKPKTTAPVQWVDVDGNVVGTEADLKNVPAGKYKLKVIGIDCPVETGYIEIKNPITLDAGSIILKNPSCGLANGTLRGFSIFNYTTERMKLAWRDANGVIVSQSPDLDNVKPGSYTFTAGLENNDCTVIYGPVKFVNIGGVTIDEQAVLITSTLCGKSEGAITGIVVESDVPAIYHWKNTVGQIVSYSKDLVNQGSGDYYLEVSNGGDCGIIKSQVYTITEINGISVSEDGVAKPATCGNSNGSIKGIVVDGATSYEWYDSRDNLISKPTTPELTNVGPGNYYLKAINQYCSKTSKIYAIADLQNNTDYGIADVRIDNAKCNLVNGGVAVSFKVAVQTYRWVNKLTGNTLNNNTSLISNLEPGTYSLYLSDENGCEKFYADYSVAREPEIAIDESEVIVADDVCGLGTGSIKGIKITGKAPFSYQWIDEKGSVFNSGSSVSGLKAGTYKLNVKDGVGCEKLFTFLVKEDGLELTQPMVDDLNVCGPGNFVISVNNTTSEFSYRLYDNLESINPLDEQKSGRFNVTVSKNRSFYISQQSGDCESSRKEIKVKVGFSLANIPNTITPNNDGINDTWVLSDIKSYPNVNVKIFNRNGAIVFESQKYQTPFDGKMKGVDLPIGTYYYHLKISDSCDPVTGSLTILR